MARVDVIVAVRNEEEAIPPFLDAIAGLGLAQGVTLGLVFVEDSSTDGTKRLLATRAAADPALRYYCLERGYGQGPAIAFGLSRSRADAMILMDVDGSHPPHVIPEMIQGFLEGAEVVQCLRRTLRNRAVYRGAGASVFFRVASLLTGVDLEEQKIYYRLVSAGIARQILSNPRWWYYLRFPLPRAQPGALRFIAVDAQERVAGESKYGPMRLAKLAIDGALSVIAPLRLAALAGLAGVLGLILLFTPAWIVGVAILAATAALVRRYSQLGRSDLLRRMVVTDQG